MKDRIMSKADKELLSNMNYLRKIALEQIRQWRLGYRGNAVTARKALVEIRQVKREYQLI